MKEVNLPSGDYIFVEVPDDATDFKDTLANGIFYKLPSGYIDSIYFDEISLNLKFEIISTTNDITEEQCKNLIDDCDIYAKCWKKYTYKGAKDIGGQFNSDYSCWTAKESLQSLIQSVGLDIKNNYLILKK